MSILYIDDDLDDIFTFEAQVREINPAFNVTSFSDSHAALEFMERAQEMPDIIFLDIHMPKISGRETLMLLKRNPAYGNVPTIMFSTSIHEAEKDSFLNLGAAGFLKKGFKMDEFKKQLAELLELHRKGEVSAES